MMVYKIILHKKENLDTEAGLPWAEHIADNQVVVKALATCKGKKKLFYIHILKINIQAFLN